MSESNYIKTDNPVVLKNLIKQRDGLVRSQADKIKELVKENAELYQKIGNVELNGKDVDESQIRKFTLQEKREINMGVYRPRYRLNKDTIKMIYANIVRSENEPAFIDLDFHPETRKFAAYYFVNEDEESAEIKKADEDKAMVNVNNIPDEMPLVRAYYQNQNIKQNLINTNEKHNENVVS